MSLTVTGVRFLGYRGVSPVSCRVWSWRDRLGRWQNGHWPSTRGPTAGTTPCIAVCLHNLAAIMRNLGLDEEARALAERARAIKTR